MNMTGNLLHNETSPYLLQHASNPVHWHAWNREALERAKRENKPILLSIGYSACHWCHVMAHESFEDADTAEIMNAHFINIKVDREERPDLDKIYQTAHSLLTGRAGGWPLTVFLTPDDRMPFFAGTYFPKERRYGMPAFSELMLHVSDIYHHRKTDIDAQNASLRDLMSGTDKNIPPGITLNNLPLDLARRQLLNAHDAEHGGFGSAPKFPHPSMIERALRHWSLTYSPDYADTQMYEIADRSLRNMAMGGIFDHVGGGFCRYSTDNFWMIPHFEKMLYDNAQLLPLYAQIGQISHEKLFHDAMHLTAEWVMREMQAENGGYYSAQDADSEGEEGKFFVWTREQIRSSIGTDDYENFAACYGLDKPANFEQHWHLHRYYSDEELASRFDCSVQQIRHLLDTCRHRLFTSRRTRIAPGTDDKILTSWNALMIRGMCITGRITGNMQYIESAQHAMHFVHKTLWRNNRLLATCRHDKAHLNAYLDDYANLLLALLECLQCRWDSDVLHWARQLADTLLQHFEDKQNGGFYFTSHDHEQLIQRSKIFSDDAMPAGNGMAVLSLQRLGLLLGNTDYLQAAERCLHAATDMQQNAMMHCTLLHALEEYLHPPTLIILRGEINAMTAWQNHINQYYLPRVFCFAIPAGAPLPEVIALKQAQADTCAYVCEGMQCLPVIYSLNELMHVLQEKFPHITYHV
jgi:uncharacterized protein YyaL (SSP411 family)